MSDRSTEPVKIEDEEELCCEDSHPSHSADVNAIPTEMLSVEKAQRLSEFLGFLADPNRLRILSILAAKEMCVGDLAAILEMNESAVSHQLRTLRAIRLVNFRKQGRHVFYSLQDRQILDFYRSAIEHIDTTT
ncbi:ArsR/SmtB family transcription factor [Chamaesiphon minutus]|uniref:Putative transcriptional regulator n=1 Tax=Chamaesiphon minutus (strain ATCC 27169 / PCC 6605) TaxID=1173020 RepID=K9UC80_CHAP6|nr:metalloregulator ArsR/SmtB family transcription factor [Chamaesiphon minutus]AFY92243.1 putative transcriptional regulator [Chamaesiphon minutus PCC 6605]